jgi:adenylate cyclase
MRWLRRYVSRNLHYLVPLLIMLVALVLGAREPAALVEFRLHVFDEFLRLKPRVYEPTPVRIVDIDDDSLEEFGQWPWPRTLLARLMTQLNKMGAAAVVFDVLFLDADRTTPARIIGGMDEIPPDDPIVARFKDLPDHDQVFADAIKNSGKVVLGFAPRAQARDKRPQAKTSFSNAGDDPQPWVPHFAGAASDLDLFEAAAAGNAMLDTFPEADGISRRVPLIIAIGDKLYPALALDALRVAQGAHGYIVKSTGASGVTSFGEHAGLNAIKVGRIIVPTSSDGTVWIHYTPHEPSRFVSAAKILDGKIDPALIKDNIVVIGTTAEGLKEFRPTPLDPAESGAEIHAQLIEQMLLGDNLSRPDWARGAEVFFMLEIGVMLVLLLPRVGARWTALVGLAGIAPAIVGSWYAYTDHNWLIDPVFPSIVGVLVYLSSSAVLFFRTETERRHVRNAFGRYVAPAIVQQLAEHPERLSLGGELRNLTIMFSDIRSFTTISEGLDAHALTHFLNTYLTPMTDTILSHQGTVDKYMADGIMAFWNAPLDDPQHGENACRAALAMRTDLAKLNEQWRAEAVAAGRDHKEVRAGIGLNTGDCVVGNLGSDQKFDYSVLGDPANVASRLEGQTKTYHVDIIIGELTAEQVRHFALLEIDLIQVVGKTQPVRIFFLFGDETVRRTEIFAALESTHDAMIAAYRAREWDAALEHLESCRAQAPEITQGVYELYEERITDLRADPPPADWDGVFAALTK